MLPVCRASDLTERPLEQRWLVENLWADLAVGIVGGEPKCCKSFLALDVAVSVASGAPCLRHFGVKRPGRVLLYAAEDALDVVRRRLLGIANAAGVSFETLDVHVITAPTLRLDDEVDRDQLAHTMARIRPRLLVLDPLVRLHRIDENVSAEVAPLLAYLRDLQRTFAAAVMLVHHAKKGASRLRAGQALRGSSELHAWGDSNLYLRRERDMLVLGIEHRAAAAMADLPLALSGDEQNLALRIADAPVRSSSAEMPDPPALAQRVTDVLSSTTAPMSWRALREACRVRASSLGDVLRCLEHNQIIVRSSRGFELRRTAPGASASDHPLQSTGNGNGKHPHDLPGETDAGSAEVQPAEG
jgi:hypothetical protein